MSVILWLDAVSTYQRNALVKSRIPFIVPHSQIFAPELGMCLKEFCVGKREKVEKISNLSILSDLFTHPEVNYREFYDNLNCDDIINFDIDDSATFYWMQNLENETNRDYNGETIFTGIL